VSRNKLSIVVVNNETQEVDKSFPAVECAFIFTEEKLPNGKLGAGMWIQNMHPESFRMMVQVMMRDKELRDAMHTAMEGYYTNPMAVTPIIENGNCSNSTNKG